MKKLVLCECGSKKAKDECCPTEKRVFFQPFSNQNEHKEFLSKIKVSSQFGLRYRGLLEFYGDHLIAYKLENPTSKSRNEFLTVLGKYLTDYLEDDCPSSWEECQPTFWEEFLLSFYPFLMKVTPKEREVETFLSELKKFTHWLDRKVGGSRYELIEKYIEESSTELKKCEHLLNRLYLHKFPLLHHDDWDPQMDFMIDLHDSEKFQEAKLIIFEVRNLNGSIVVITDIDSNLTYNIKGLPSEIIIPGMIISGGIARKNGDWIWTWYHPESVFPLRAKKFLKNVKLGL
jgi:hypothetical protein